MRSGCVRVYVSAYMEDRSLPRVLFLTYCLPYSLREGLSFDLELTNYMRLGWLIQPQRLPSLTP